MLSATLEVQGGKTLTASNIKNDKDLQWTTSEFDETLKAGSKVTLKHTFTGTLNDLMAGFYRSSWKGPNGEKKWIATTQMEATDARRAFPCFDEPALKAQFSVTLIADKEHTCLGNMDVKSEKEVDSKVTGGKRKAVTFNKTPPMSTYLLAFIIGELKVIETNDFKVPVRVFCTPDQNIDHGKFSMDLAAKTLAFYEKEFSLDYPLPKMDMVAIPDFSAGAMENWGLVTYRVVDVLLDEKVSSASAKERVAEVVQHELAHQWFGNIVTMDWWEGLWLNEGFATWMSWYSCNKFYPEWKVWQTYVTDNLQSALGLDSLRSSHPIEVPVMKADDINQIFDAISYSKGSCVIRMMSKYLGEDVFMEGIRRYLKKHAYGNTETSDLWAALSDASGKPVEKIMSIWTKNIGHPLVTVTENEATKSITLKQNRFLRTGDVKPEEDQTLFPITLGLRTKDGINEDLVLSQREQEFKLPDLDFYKINADHSGIYRTAYPPHRLEKLGQAAKEGLLSVEDRAGMIADAGALSSAGYQETSALLSLLKGFDDEANFVVWAEILSRLSALRGAWTFQPEPVRDAIKAFQRDISSTKARQLGWNLKDSDDHILQQFKAMMFGSAGGTGDKETIKAAQDMLASAKAGKIDAIKPEIRGAVYMIALENGGEAEYEYLLERYHSAPTTDERNTALRTLGYAKQPHLIERTLKLAAEAGGSGEGGVKLQDIYLPLSGLRAHPEGINARWQWMTENWKLLQEKLPAGLNMLSAVVQICCGAFTTREQKQMVEKFFEREDKKVCSFPFLVLPSFSAMRHVDTHDRPLANQ